MNHAPDKQIALILWTPTFWRVILIPALWANFGDRVLELGG